MLLNIKQKLFNFILSFGILVVVSACQSAEEKAALVTQAPIPEKLPTEIAILMPSSGALEIPGKQYANLIKTGLEDGAKTDLSIKLYDGADEPQILNSIEKIIKNKTKIILGPINSPLTSLIMEKAKQHNIIIITLSNNPVLADEKLYVFGHAPLKQQERIINYFLENDYKNFIALLPAGKYSHTLAKVLQNTVIEKQGTLVRTEYYGETPEQLEKSVKLISEIVDNLNEMEDNTKKSVIFLADDSKNLTLILRSIAAHNLDKKAIIAGDSRINIEYPEPIDLVFTGSLNISVGKIKEKAQSLGINHMTFMHSMAYDLGRMTASYIGENFIEGNFIARLNSQEPYIGISGEIFFKQHIAQRHYDIIRRENNEYHTQSL